jgi:hypothetical protein
MKTTIVMLGLLACLVAAPVSATDAAEPDGPSAKECQPVWIDNDGNPHLDPSCIGPVFDNSP